MEKQRKRCPVITLSPEPVSLPSVRLLIPGSLSSVSHSLNSVGETLKLEINTSTLSINMPTQITCWHSVGWYFIKRRQLRASLVVQWLRIHLPMQGTRVRALVQEDPTCRGATKPVRHNYWACTLEPANHNYWAREPQILKPARHKYWRLHTTNTEAHIPQILKPAHLEPVLHSKRSHHNEKPAHRNKE